MWENKQKICDLLLITLNETRHFDDLVSLVYYPENDVVIATFDNGYTKDVNVAMDSGIAMIIDIIKQLT